MPGSLGGAAVMDKDEMMKKNKQWIRRDEQL